ncbi:MAG: HAMP domain-containing sensor histidine kinase [Pseudomonadota bacterium]
MTDHYGKMRGVAHDINGLMGRAMLLAEQLSAHRDATVARRAGRIGDAIDQVAAICRRELSATRRTEAPTDLDGPGVERLLGRVASLIGLEAELSDRPIDFYLSAAPDIRATVDEPTLFRVLFNLGLNAANAIARDGGSWIEISAMQAYGRLYFDVCDDGPGLPPHVLSYLYPRQGDAASRSGRIGAGLVTAASLASDAGGELRLVKSTSAGTHFCLITPEYVAAAEPPRPDVAARRLRQADEAVVA